MRISYYVKMWSFKAMEKYQINSFEAGKVINVFQRGNSLIPSFKFFFFLQNSMSGWKRYNLNICLLKCASFSIDHWEKISWTWRKMDTYFVNFYLSSRMNISRFLLLWKEILEIPKCLVPLYSLSGTIIRSVWNVFGMTFGMVFHLRV